MVIKSVGICEYDGWLVGWLVCVYDKGTHISLASHAFKRTYKQEGTPTCNVLSASGALI